MIKDQLQDDLKNAMRAQEKERVATYRFILAAIKQKEVDERITLDDTQVLVIFEKLIKQHKDAIEQFKTAERHDLVAKETTELNLLLSYLPKPLNDNEVNQLIQQALVETQATSIRDMGKVMNLLKPQIQGRADMGKVSQIVKEKLSP